MNLLWTELAWSDYLYWQSTDKKQVKRINSRIKDIQRAPFDGLGKPEPLKFELAGKWSRRIDAEHRLVYEIAGREIIIFQCKYHYKK